VPLHVRDPQPVQLRFNVFWESQAPQPVDTTVPVIWVQLLSVV